MQYISYQGIYDGTNFEDAGTPNQIGKSFNKGFATVQNVWRINGQTFLGVFQPITPVADTFIQGPRFFLNAMNDEMRNWLQHNQQNHIQIIFHFPTHKKILL